MTDTTDAAINADRRRVQHAAVRAGLWVGLASAAVVVLLSAVTVTAMFASSRADRPPDGARPDRGGHGPRVIELDRAVPIAVVAGILGVLALGVIAWYVARRTAQPLADALEVQRAFVADASHELRTPLTTLTSRIQLAQHRAERGGDVTAALDDLRRDAAVMDAVLGDLLLAAESAGGRDVDRGSSCEVRAVAEETVSTLAPVAAEKGVGLCVDVAPGLVAAADAIALRRAITALVDNAVRVAPGGTAVTITGARAGRSVEVRVVDHGHGIVGIDPQRVFERFARSDDGSSGRRGFGLGLALVRDVAARFGGAAVIESTSRDGTTVLVTLPSAAGG